MINGPDALQPLMFDSQSASIVLARRVYGSLFDLSESVPQKTAISVVVPVYNEVQTIATVIERVLDTGFDVEIIVVDDASTDGTREFLRNYRHPRVKMVYHEKNAGKGAALRSGFALASRPYIFVQDADLEYDPKDFARMLPPLMDGRADMVYGSRFLGGPHRVLFFWHYVGNRLLTVLSNVITDLNLSDMETRQKACLRERLMELRLSASRFTFEPEITAKAARARWRVFAVPISYSGRTYEEGKKSDGVTQSRRSGRLFTTGSLIRNLFRADGGCQFRMCRAGAVAADQCL